MATQLAAIFSGWIAAVVGFYFIQGQAREAATAAEQAGKGQGRSALETANLAVDAYKKRNAELLVEIEQLREAMRSG